MQGFCPILHTSSFATGLLDMMRNGPVRAPTPHAIGDFLPANTVLKCRRVTVGKNGFLRLLLYLSVNARTSIRPGTSTFYSYWSLLLSRCICSAGVSK